MLYEVITSSFYLKSMLEGLSPIPEYSSDTIAEVRSILTDLSDAHRILSKIDPVTMEKIAPSDAYRIEKMALLYLETKIAPSEWFRKNPPIPIITVITSYSIHYTKLYDFGLTFFKPKVFKQHHLSAFKLGS